MARKLLPRLWIVLIAMVVLLLQIRGPLRRWEGHAFDRSLGAHPIAPWPRDFVAVVVDQPAITKLNSDAQWPIRRQVAADIWDRLHALGAKTIVYDGKFTTRGDPEIDADVLTSMPLVLLPITYEARPWDGAASFLGTLAMDLEVPGAPVYSLDELQPPLPEFANAARATGHVVGRSDSDGLRRTHFPFVRLEEGGAIPSIALCALALHRGADLARARWTEEALDVPGLPTIPLRRGALVLELSPNAPGPDEVRALELFDPEREADVRRRVEGRLALVYMEVASDLRLSPLGIETPGGLLLAHAIRTMDAGHAPRFPAPGFVYLALVAFACAVAGRVTRLAPRNIALLGVGASLSWLIVQALLFRAADVFLPVSFPALFLLGSSATLSLGVTFRRLDVAEARADAAKAPRGEIALVFTDIQGSTSFWEREPEAMRKSLEVHNRLLREVLAEAAGYEVKTEGDAFMLAFASAPSAAAWCLTVQERLLAQPWPAEILAQPDGREDREGERILWRGLRVRMGVHVGKPEPREDPLTGRMDYFGPPVNRAARVAGAAYGGQIVLSGDAWAKVEPVLASLPSAQAKDLGRHFLKGLLSEERLIELLPASLAARKFPPPKTGEPSVGEFVLPKNAY